MVILFLDKSMFNHQSTDWTDNPNPRPAEEFVWVDFQHNREWSQMGHLTFDRYDATSDIRFDRCAMLDEMGQYMKH